MMSRRFLYVASIFSCHLEHARGDIAVERYFGICIVVHDRDVMLFRKGDDVLQVFGRHNAAGGIGGKIHPYESSLVRYLFLDVLKRWLKSKLGHKTIGHRRGSYHECGTGKSRITRVWHEYLVAVIGKRERQGRAGVPAPPGRE